MNKEKLINKMQEIEEFLRKADMRISWIRDQLDDIGIDDNYVNKWLDDLEYLIFETTDVAEVVECSVYDVVLMRRKNK